MTSRRFARFAVPLLTLALTAVALPVAAQQPPRPATAAPAPAPAVTPTHLAAARDLVIASGLARSFFGVIPTIMQQIETNVTRTRPELSTPMRATLTSLEPEFSKLPNEIIDAAANMYAGVMTEQECKEAAAFFKTPSGQKYVNKQSAIVAELQPLSADWANRISTMMFNRVHDEMKKKGFEF